MHPARESNQPPRMQQRAGRAFARAIPETAAPSVRSNRAGYSSASRLAGANRSVSQGKERISPWNSTARVSVLTVIEEDISMSLVTLVVVLIVVGVLLWLVNNYIPMDGKIKSILNAVVVIAVVIGLLQAFGLLDSLSGIHVGR